jgi:hypothetical protein
MSESRMISAVNAALRREGINDDVTAAGQFSPQGSTGGMFVGGIIGDDVGGAAGLAGGSIIGRGAAGAARGLPRDMIVGVSAGFVYGFAGRSRSREPNELVFRVSRQGLTVKVGSRVNVRILELFPAGGSETIALEGNRLPVTHSKDVIDALTSS